jgi:amidase
MVKRRGAGHTSAAAGEREMKDTLGAFVPGSELRIAGAGEGPLAGLSFAAKDIYDLAGQVTGCGNPDWARTHEPAAATAPAVQALLDAGATLFGKTITDELAYSLNGQNFHYGTPANANAPGRIPGGSSSGSASAVASGLVDLALGSDTGGSIRVPASYCGILGLRPTHGRLTLAGVMPLAPSFDTVGWFAREPAVLRRAGEVLFGAMAEDAPARGRLRLAEDAFQLAEPAAWAALAPLVERLEARLGKAERVRLGEPGGGLGAWMLRFRILQAREIWAVHGAWIGDTKPAFGPEIAERFAWAQTIAEEDAAAAKPEREAFAARLAALLADGSLLCLPSAPGIAPRLDTPAEQLVEHRGRTLSLTCIAGLARLPQISLPLARVAGCPLGLSLIGPPGADLTLLTFAETLMAEGD